MHLFYIALFRSSKTLYGLKQKYKNNTLKIERKETSYTLKAFFKKVSFGECSVQWNYHINIQCWVCLLMISHDYLWSESIIPPGQNKIDHLRGKNKTKKNSHSIDPQTNVMSSIHGSSPLGLLMWGNLLSRRVLLF